MPGGMAPGDERDARTDLGEAALAYADTLHSLARYLTGNLADAEDLVQETYARALRAADQFTPGSEPQGLAVPDLAEHLHQRLSTAAKLNPTVGGLDTVRPGRCEPSATEQRWLRG